MTWTMLAIILVALVAGLAALFFAVRRMLEAQKPKDDTQSLLLLQNQINQIAQTLDVKLGQVASESKHTVSEVMRVAQYQSTESAKLIGDVMAKLARVDEASRQTLAMNEQIKKLQDTLTNPKQRGILGEYYLETVLKNVLPPGSYQMQYAFADGVIVDAAVFVDKRIIPIDSKFSLENYNRILEARDPAEKKRYELAFVADLKLRIDETAKYVKPQEDTMDFAFMFIPSEAIYYDLLNGTVGAVAEEASNLMQYAAKKHVTIVSPTVFVAFLQTVLQGLRNQKISEEAREIMKQVENLKRHLGAYESYAEKLGKNLSTTVSMYNHASREFFKIDKDFLKLTGETIGVKPELIEGPASEE